MMSLKRVRDILVSAFEGGSNYWYFIQGYDLPKGRVDADLKKGGSLQPKGDYYHWSQIVPTVKGGVLYVNAPGDYDMPVALTQRSLRLGERVMREKYPQHWADWKSENDDSVTGDVFLQCCMFGECIYG